MRVVLQNVSDKDNKCFYYAFFGAAKEYLKKCKFFKKKINVDFLKQENLNIDRIKSRPELILLFKKYISTVFEFYTNLVNTINFTESIDDLYIYDVFNESKIDIEKIKKNERYSLIEKQIKIKEIILKSENLSVLLGLDNNICKLFIKHDKLKNYNFMIDNDKIIISFIEEFIKIQFNYNSFTTMFEIDLFHLYLREKCSDIEIKTITLRHSNNHVFKTNHIDAKKFFYSNLKEHFKSILNYPVKNQTKTFVFLFTTDIHYRFLILNDKSVFTFKDISDLNKILLDKIEEFLFINEDTINSDYGRSIELSPESTPNIPDLIDFSSPTLATSKSPELLDDVPPHWEKFDVSSSSKSPELATSRSPQRNYLKEDKLINLILNLPINLTTLSQNTEYDKIITSSIEKVNLIFLKYKKLKKLKIIRTKTKKIYKFNYTHPENYLSEYNNEDFKQIIFEIISIIKIPKIKDYLSLSLPNPLKLS